MPTTFKKLSYRDKCATVYRKNSLVFRFISSQYEPAYRKLMQSGLYKHLTEEGLLVCHEEVEAPDALGERQDDFQTVIKPNKIPFISYPYEWCFSQLKDAALLTLRIQKIALAYGMTLKDANAWNVQFHGGKPVFIDTSSFEIHEEGSPWTAYGQFCRFFLLPLVLMSKCEPRLNSLLLAYPDGIPLDIGIRLLPLSTWLNPSLIGHLAVTAFMNAHYRKSQGQASDSKQKVKLQQLLYVLNDLEDTISNLRLKQEDSVWSAYYKDNAYSPEAFAAKEIIVERILAQSKRKKIWDLGANTGHYSRLASPYADMVLAMDYDALCVENNYLDLKKRGKSNILPLLMDCTAPSPALGWALMERLSLPERGPCDLLMALALIHHLVIGRSINLEEVAAYMAKLGQELIIEFVPEDDSQVELLRKQKAGICQTYNQAAFEEAFCSHFILIEKQEIVDSKRIIYHFVRLNGDK